MSYVETQIAERCFTDNHEYSTESNFFLEAKKGTLNDTLKKFSRFVQIDVTSSETDPRTVTTISDLIS